MTPPTTADVIRLAGAGAAALNTSTSPPAHLLPRLLPCSPPSVLPLRAGRRSSLPLPIAARISTALKCSAKSTTPEDRQSDSDLVASGIDDDDALEDEDMDGKVIARKRNSSTKMRSMSSDSLSLGIPEPVYEVVEVKSNGLLCIRKIHRRSLLKSSGLRPRDIRSVDPSLWLTNSMPTLLVRENAILLNFGSLRAIIMQERVLVFNYNCEGSQAFIESLLPRLNAQNTAAAPGMPFVLEVVEAALISRIEQLEQRVLDLEPQVQHLLRVLPNRLKADALEELRTSKQNLVELCSRAGALREMMLDLLEDTVEIRQICVMGRNCTASRQRSLTNSSLPLDKQVAKGEEEEIEMLLENYLQRCDSCHGHADKLLDSAKELEDSLAVNLSSRRLEVGKVELLLQVGAFFVGVGALVAGIFGMNKKTKLEDHVISFIMAAVGISVGVVVGFFLMYWYLRRRKIL